MGAYTVRGPEAGDPASVAFDAVKEGKEMFNRIAEFNGGVLLFQLLSTDQLY